MKNFFYNIGYFVKEAAIVLKLNKVSNVFSLISTGLIFFILAMVTTGWWVSSQVVETIKGEAEINVYYDEAAGETEVVKLMEGINEIQGIQEVRLIDEGEAYRRMQEILGKEAKVLNYFDSNPFSPFIEIRITLEEMDPILDRLNQMEYVEYVRDNREILERLRSIADVLDLLGYVVIFAVGFSTLVIISHIIRLGVHNNREQITTLRLLGAPEAFIAFPFILTGILLTLGGGGIASVLAVSSIKYVYAQVTGPLPFIPLPPIDTIVSDLVILILCLSALLGLVGSLFGLTSSRSS
jgi:cell division transport system permease protein